MYKRLDNILSKWENKIQRIKITSRQNTETERHNSCGREREQR